MPIAFFAGAPLYRMSHGESGACLADRLDQEFVCADLYSLRPRSAVRCTALLWTAATSGAVAAS